MERAFKAIVVGIETYDDARTWQTLDGVGATAARVARAFGAEPLTLPEGGRKAEAPRALGEAIQAIPDRATLLVHWIGHGVTSDQHYLICRDTAGPDQLHDYEAIPSGWLGRVIAKSRAERVVVILDTCFSGQGGGDIARRYRDSLAQELDREGWQRVACVIASSHPLDKAVAGRFSEGLVEALENPDRHLKWSRADAYIDPERLAGAVMDLLGEAHKAVHPRFSKEGIGQDIIPNPLFRPSTGAEDLETRQRLEGVFGENAHFDLAGRGIEAGEAGYFFTGRRQSQEAVIEWLESGDSDLMIVTGPPGAGKSALIGRIVTLSVPSIRQRLRAEGAVQPNDPVPPDDSVDIAIHAKGKSVFQVATAIGRAIGLDREVADQPGIADMLDRMKATGGRRTIVIDALDEAGGGQAGRIANEIVRPLAAMPGVRVLVGTRRSLDGALIPDGEERHGRLVKAFGPDADIRDLADEPETAADIADFVVRRLRASATPGPNDWIETAGRNVAAAAEGSFLCARLVARSLEAFPGAPLDDLPADAAAAFARDVASRFSDDEQRVTDMLRALAFGLGRGLSRAVWAPVASALAEGGRTYTDDDVVWMLRHVGSYIVETTVETDGIGQAVYRLIHQALADHLTREPVDAHQRIVDAITRGLEGEAWLGADLYLRRHLLEHAVLADRWTLGQVAFHVIQMPMSEMSADERRAAEELLAGHSDLHRLFLDPAVLAISDPAVLLAMQQHLLSAAARRVFGYCLLAADRLGSLSPVERWSLLHLTALTQNDEEWAATAQPPGAARWRGLWARTRPTTPHLVLRGHEGWVTSVAMGAVNGRMLIVSSGMDGTVRLWDAEVGTPVGEPLTGHEGSGESVAIGSVDARALVVSGSADFMVRRWDADDGRPLGAPMAGHAKAVVSVAIGAVGERLLIVSGGPDGTVRLWDPKDGTPVSSLKLPDGGLVRSVVLGSVDDRALIFSLSDHGTIWRWDADDSSWVGMPITSGEGEIRSVAFGFASGRSLLVSGGAGGQLQRWDAQNGSRVGAAMTGHKGAVYSVAFGRSGKQVLIVSGGDDGTVRLWDAETGLPLGAPMTGQDRAVLAVALATVGGRAMIASGGSDGAVRLWDTGAALRREATTNSPDVRSISIAVAAIGGRELIVTGHVDGTVQLWDAEKGEPVGKPMRGHEGWVISVAFGTIDGRDVIVSASTDGALCRWQAADGTPVGAPSAGHGDPIMSMTLGTVRGRLLAVSSDFNGILRQWDAAYGSLVGAPIQSSQNVVTSVTLGAVSGRAVIASGNIDGTVRLWNAEDGLPIGAPMACEGKVVLSLALGAVSDRPLIAAGCGDGRISVWDAETNEPVGGPMQGHLGEVESVAIGAFGGRALIVSGGHDGTVRLWDPSNGHEILQIPVGIWIYEVVILSDGRVCLRTATGLIMLKIQI